MTKLIAISIMVFGTFLAGHPLTTFADVKESQKAEVEHILLFVETSDCMFERNGKKHDAYGAFKHIKRKYKYFRDEITTTEEFIEYSGTKSTRSGKDYLIYCGNNEPIQSSVWLLEELTQFREQSY